MRRARHCCVLIGLVLAGMGSGVTSAAAPVRSPTFEERVLAQEAIERVYYSHRVGTGAAFEEAVPGALLEHTVRTYRRQSKALEEFWNLEVSATTLAAEWQRISANTRFPDRLREIYAALDHDALMIQECFVRHVLVDRLARKLFAFDDRIHGAAQSEARQLREQVDRGRAESSVASGSRTELEVRRADPDGPAPTSSASELTAAGIRQREPVLHLAEEPFARRRARAPQSIGWPGRLRESAQEFFFEVLLREEPDGFAVASYSVPKQDWNAWWSSVEAQFDPDHVEAVALESAPVPGTNAEGTLSGCVPDDTWENGDLDDFLVPEGRGGHSAVWTGTHLLIWGGNRGSSSSAMDTGGLYDPLVDTWKQISALNAPTARSEHTTVWTGQEMIVWGGSLGLTNTGGRYDPGTDTWTSTSMLDAPSPRRFHAAVWTGEEMIVWGGSSLSDTGGRYDPASDTWRATATLGAPEPRSHHTAIWTGSRMVIWGGSPLDEPTGGRYDPLTDSWAPTTTLGAPSRRLYHSAVWTGTEMVIWGGYDGFSYPQAGARYDPSADVWTAMTAVGAPAGRGFLTAVWDGSEVLLWGGGNSHDDALFAGGARYDPQEDRWTAMATPEFLEPRQLHSAVWTGSAMVIWGGAGISYGSLDDGGRYDPSSDTWTPTFHTNRPSARARHASVWTGNLMLVWGGHWRDSGGARYDPLTDTWTGMSTEGAPNRRSLPQAIWTGEEMILWGGEGLSYDPARSSGGRYDPWTDSWTPTSTLGAPDGRSYHSTVWTGEEMIVWGGLTERDYLHVNTGGRYRPSTDTWTPTSTLDAPMYRREHTAVWSGEEMIVWGGEDGSRGSTTGGRYDPVTDRWLPTSLLDVPEGRRSHSAIWTGTHMLIWGGSFYLQRFASGGLYDPRSDSWRPTSLSGAPAARNAHSAVWTGNRMIVWGGVAGWLTSGGIYDPATDAWLPMQTDNAPEGRWGQSTVWAGNPMIVWGGTGASGTLSTGGRYYFGNTSDFDQDGFTVCDLDCNDLDGEVHPGAVEFCDGQDSDCDGLLPVEELDADGDGSPFCADCDDDDRERFPGNVEVCDLVDNDCDGEFDGHPTLCGVGECAAYGVCVWGVDTCRSGQPVAEECDGLDNDCDGTLPISEQDRDHDGWSACAGDCDDADIRTHPGAAEVNDHRDNQCSGDPGYLLVDEVTGPMIFSAGVDAVTLSWPAQDVAAGYEVSRSSRPDLADGCSRFRTTDTSWTDGDELPLGSFSYYLVQAILPFSGSLGRDSSGVERALVCGAENHCDDGMDNDADSRVDCNDPNCLGKGECTAFEVMFQDTLLDDVPAEWLEEFFQQLFLQLGDYIYFGVGGGTLPWFEWCAARADFYRDAYLELAPGGGIATSGGWDKWYSSEGGAWTGPITDGFENWYGDYCAEPYSWCAEFGLGGHVPGIAPWEQGVCEIFDNITCGDVWTTLTIRVGLDRQEACSF